MAHITRWAGIGQKVRTTFGALATNKSGIGSTYYLSSVPINNNTLKGNNQWWYCTDMDINTYEHIVDNPVENARITGYIIWKSGGKSNVVESPDVLSSYTPATVISVSSTVTSVYSDFDGNINITATTNGSRSASKVPVNVTRGTSTAPAGSTRTNTPYDVKVSHLFNELPHTSSTGTYYITVDLDPTAINIDEPTTDSYIASNTNVSGKLAIGIKSAVGSITVNDYSIHINAKDVYNDVTYTITAYGASNKQVYDTTLTASISNTNVASVSATEGKLIITAKDISNSATKFASATITLKSTCTSKTGGVTSKGITLYVYDNNIALVRINTGDSYDATLVTVELPNETLDSWPTIIPVNSSSSSALGTATYASVSDVSEVKGSDNKYKYIVKFTAIKAGTQYFYVSNGTYVAVIVSDITLTLSNA